jgi:hypothetical protein
MSITKDQVLKMDWKSIQAAIKAPETKADMQNLLRDHQVVPYFLGLMREAQDQQVEQEAQIDAQLNRVVPPSTEALAAEAVAMAAEPVATEAATAVVVPQESVAVTEPERKKIVREYQVRDEDGKPIGRPTHLEAWSTEEMLEKMQIAHENATRAFHRLKQQKLTFKQERTLLTPEQIAEAARVALEAKDTEKVTDVIHQVIETEYKKREITIREKEAFEEGRAISNEFMRRHLHDYNPCEANQQAIGEYFRDHNLDFTLDNLEVAFQDLKEQGDKLAKVETTEAVKTATVAANPAPVAAVVTPATPVIPVAETPTAVPAPVTPPPQVVVNPVVETTAPTPAAPNQQPAARRPGVNGGIAPGTLSAQRPGAPDPALARKEFLKIVKDMHPEVMKKKLKTDPQFVKQLQSYGIRIQ